MPATAFSSVSSFEPLPLPMSARPSLNLEGVPRGFEVVALPEAVCEGDPRDLTELAAGVYPIDYD
jgi:hypothetical protein